MRRDHRKCQHDGTTHKAAKKNAAEKSAELTSEERGRRLNIFACE
jgi:hypothetical protein